jgi:hypothetical protein
VKQFTGKNYGISYAPSSYVFVEAAMAALARVLNRTTGMNLEVEALKKSILVLSGLGVFVWLLFATYGLDLSAGFF